MKEWLKFIGLSFFSDKIAKQAPRRGLGSMIFSAFLGAALLLLGLLAAFAFPFSANYRNTPELTATVQSALSSSGAALEVRGGKLYADRTINTLDDEGDRAKYSRGYDIVIDTRDADTYDDFIAYCVSPSGKEIAYEQYLELDVDARSVYEFKIRYTGKTRVLDDALVGRCEAYLDGVQNEDIRKAWAEIEKNDNYAAAVYELCVKAYYPSLSAYENNGGAPKTRNYYYHNYGNRNKTLYVFCDSMVGTLTSDCGASQTFYGLYSKMPDGKIGQTAQDADDFIADSVRGASSIAVYGGLMSFFSVSPFMALAGFAAAIALFCFVRLLKLDELKFGAAGKIICSFVIISATISALSVLALGYLAPQSILGWLEGIIFFAVLTVRIAIMLTVDGVKRKKQQNAQTEQTVPEANGVAPSGNGADNDQSEKAEDTTDDIMRG